MFNIDWSLVIMGLGMLGAFGIGFIGIPYAKAKGWLKDEKPFENTLDLIKLMSMVMQEIKPEDNFMNIITKVSSVCVLSAEQMFKAGDNAAKKAYAVDMAVKMCEELGVELNDNKKAIINATIESLVKLLPSEKKEEPKN
jgi:hypothetical protein